jgi:hypothetical protein
MEHEAANCGARLREVLTAYAKGEPIEAVAAWITWYLEHHCQVCGVCDDIPKVRQCANHYFSLCDAENRKKAA